MSKYKYRVCGWRWRHVEWPTWAMRDSPPKWLAAALRKDPKRLKKYWTLERVYRRVETSKD